MLHLTTIPCMRILVMLPTTYSYRYLSLTHLTFSISKEYNELSYAIMPCHAFIHKGKYFIFQNILGVWPCVELSQFINLGYTRYIMVNSRFRPTRDSKLGIYNILSYYTDLKSQDMVHEH